MLLTVRHTVIEGGGATTVEVQRTLDAEAGNDFIGGEGIGQLAKARATGKAKEPARSAIRGDEGAGGVLGTLQAGNSPATIHEARPGL